MYICYFDAGDLDSSLLPSHSVVSVLLIRCKMGCHEYKGDFAKTFINFVSPANIIK